jgi:endonuclease III
MMTMQHHKIFEVLEVATLHMNPPMSVLLTREFVDRPFIVLISCLLSLRTRDSVTYPVCRKLFSKAGTPQEMLFLSSSYLEQLFFPLGFYRKKAAIVHAVCRDLIERFGGVVPSTEEKLRSIKGVGHKTAALVLAEGYNIPAICVDTHVHRIANRLGMVTTKTPRATEIALKKLLPQDYWLKVNRLFVVWGQNICVSRKPFCESLCSLKGLCPRQGVKESR